MHNYQPQTIPRSSHITDLEDLRQEEKKPNQVIKDVNNLYLLDPGVKHKPGILEGTHKIHTCLSITAAGVLLQTVDSTDYKKKNNLSSH